MARQGSDIRCVIGEDLNKKYFKKIPVLPYIVNRHKSFGNLRENLNIKKDTLVVGRHGGYNTFDLNFVKKAIEKTLNIRKDIIFLFLNTKVFLKHERIIYLPKTTSLVFKSQFIDSCDYMLHGRKHGETFGLAVAEFSAANKQIISYALSKDKEHLRILKDEAIRYTNEHDLIKILLNLKKVNIKNKLFNCYKQYEPEFVMRKFDEICLTKKLKTQINYSELIRDLPWEIFIVFDNVKLYIVKKTNHILPKNLKKLIKAIISKFLN